MVEPKIPHSPFVTEFVEVVTEFVEVVTEFVEVSINFTIFAARKKWFFMYCKLIG